MAHAQGITGTISGTVTDPSGAGVPAATVTVVQEQTNESRTVTSSNSGSFSIPQLAPGTYNVTVAKPGFGNFQQTGIVPNIDQKAEVNPALKIGSEETRVDVSAAPPVLQSVKQVRELASASRSELGGVEDAQLR